MPDNSVEVAQHSAAQKLAVVANILSSTLDDLRTMTDPLNGCVRATEGTTRAQIILNEALSDLEASTGVLWTCLMDAYLVKSAPRS